MRVLLDRPGGARAERVRGHGAGAPRGRIVIAAGGTTGVYYGYAKALASALEARDPGLRVDVLATSGSMENLRLVADGRATLAFTAADAAAEAALGGPPFGRRLPIAALARVYDDYITSSCPRRAGCVRSPSSTAGRSRSGRRARHAPDRRAAAGRARGGAARRRTRARRVGRGSARRAHLRFFWSGGLPTPGVDALAHTEPLRLLGLDERLDGLQARFGAVYRAAAIPSGTYGLTRQVSTIAVPNLLVTHERADAALVRLVTATLFSGAARSPAPSWPPPRSTAARRSRPPPLSCIPPPWTGTATPRPEPGSTDPRGASPPLPAPARSAGTRRAPWGARPIDHGPAHGAEASTDHRWIGMKQRRASSPRRRGDPQLERRAALLEQRRGWTGRGPSP